MPVLAPSFEAPVGADDGADDEDAEMRVVGDNMPPSSLPPSPDSPRAWRANSACTNPDG